MYGTLAFPTLLKRSAVLRYVAWYSRLGASCAAGERLYHAHDHVQQKRDRRRALAQQEQLSQCTFAPKVSHRHLNKQTYRPIQERAADCLRLKNERLARCASSAASSGVTMHRAAPAQSRVVLHLLLPCIAPPQHSRGWCFICCYHALRRPSAVALGGAGLQ